MLDRIKNEPALVGGAVTAVLNALVLLDVLNLSVEQITGINVALAAVLALFVRSQVTPVARSADERGVADVNTMLLVAILVCCVLLLFGIRLG